MRSALVSQIVYLLIKSNKIKDDRDKIHTFHFRNGDRDLIVFSNGLFYNNFYELHDISEFTPKDNFYGDLQEKFEVVKEDPNKIVLLIYYHKPKSDETYLHNLFLMDLVKLKETGEKIENMTTEKAPSIQNNTVET